MTKDELIKTLTELNYDDARYSITELFEKIVNATYEYEIDTGDSELTMITSDYDVTDAVCHHLAEQLEHPEKDWLDTIFDVKKALSKAEPYPPIYRLDENNIYRNITREDIKELRDKMLTYLQNTTYESEKKELLVKLNSIYNHLDSKLKKLFESPDNIFEDIQELCNKYSEKTGDSSLDGCFSNFYDSKGIREVIADALNPLYNPPTDALYNILDMLSEYNGEDYTYHILDEDNTFCPIEKEDLEDLITDIRKKLGEE